jgi:serine protease AprX
MTIFTALTQDSNLVFHPDANGHNQLSRLGVSPDNKWIFVNGTSFSTPLVAGCCAIIRRALRLKLIRWRFPATLVKAILVNGAVDMSVNRQSRGPAIRAAPSNTQGFGRVDLTKSLLCINDTDRGGFYPKGDVTPLMANSSQKVPVPMPSFANDPGFKGLPVKLQPVLKVTLCYADPPGALDSPALLNVLHLKVVASDKTFRYGNTNTTIPDSNNNVQKVVWPNIPPGDAEIWIECASLDAGSLVAGQKWSVAWYVETRAPSDNKLQYLLDNTIYGGRKAVMVGVGLIAVATAAAASRMSAQTDE